jgi:dTDP-4-amino-4,6-dideoxygalactose transaminase
MALSSPLRRIALCRTEISPEAQESVAQVLASGWVTTGPRVEEFEKDFAAYVGADHAIAVSSCTAAIELSLQALNLPEGSRVMTSAITFCGAVTAIVHAGLEPILVDVNPTTCMPDEHTIADAVRKWGPPDALIVTHFAGHPAPVERLAAAAQLPLDLVIEDAAHALATYVGDKAVGTISAATCFSFYASKNLPIGEGGMITTSDPELADKVRQTRLHGMSRDAWKRYMPGSSWRYDVEEPGLKANMTDIQAAIGSAQLQHLPRWQEQRDLIAERYTQRLSGIEHLCLPPLALEGRHAWHLYVVRVGKQFGMSRDEFMDELAQRGIGCSVHFIPIHHLSHYRYLARPYSGALPNADAVFDEIVSLPLHPGLTYEDVDYIADQIADLAAEGGTREPDEPIALVDVRRPVARRSENGKRATM